MIIISYHTMKIHYYEKHRAKWGNASFENKNNNCTRINNFQFICNHPLTRIKHVKLKKTFFFSNKK